MPKRPDKCPNLKPLSKTFLWAAMGVYGVIGLVACTAPQNDYKAWAEKDCATNWKDSGFQYRVVQKDINTYSCQVKVGNHWIPEQNVKVDLSANSL